MSHRNNPHLGAREWSLLLVLSGLWGGSLFFFKVLVAAFPPFTIVLGRVGLAAPALNALLVGRGDPMPTSPRLWHAFAVTGVLNNVVPFTLIAFGETRISSGSAAILNATTPAFTVLAAHWLTADEKLAWAKGAGDLLGLLGVAVLIGPGVLSGFGRGDLAGEVACLLAAATYGFAGLYGRRFRGLPPLQIAAGQVTASTVILISITLLVDRPWLLPWPSAQAWAASIGIALVSTALAYTVYFRILAVAGATNLLLVTFLLPVSALVLGTAFLEESLSSRSVAGMALIGAGLAAIDGRIWAMIRKRSSIAGGTGDRAP